MNFKVKSLNRVGNYRNGIFLQALTWLVSTQFPDSPLTCSPHSISSHLHGLTFVFIHINNRIRCLSFLPSTVHFSLAVWVWFKATTTFQTLSQANLEFLVLPLFGRSGGDQCHSPVSICEHVNVQLYQSPIPVCMLQIAVVVVNYPRRRAYSSSASFWRLWLVVMVVGRMCNLLHFIPLLYAHCVYGKYRM